MIKIAIIEDDTFIRESLKEYFSSVPDMECILAKGSVESFIHNLNKNNIPDIILMDIGLPGMSGISGIRLIKQQYPEINIIMLTVYFNSEKIFSSLCSGASGYLLKNTPFNEIKQAIETVYAGGSFMSPRIARKVVDYFRTGEKKETSSSLTPKEKQIVLSLVDGLSYKMIAEHENITIDTVRSHIKNIYKKLQVHTKADVIRKSLQGEI